MDARSSLPPHVYETSCLAYRGLAVDGRHQSILVSGESGAGKTETVKIVLGHLAGVHEGGGEGGVGSGGGGVGGGEGGGSAANPVVRRVLDSNPLLEAFGNAKTVRNDNSSRFGKYLRLQFDVEDATSAAHRGRAVPSCVLAGSSCETYLLEKSRVVGHGREERGYHVFYQLLGMEDETEKIAIWDGLAEADLDSFRYVGDTDTKTIEGMTDGKRWAGTREALGAVGIGEE